MKKLSQSVSYELNESVAVLISNNPPVTAMSYHVRQGLVDGLEMAQSDENVQAIVLHCEGRTFFPGMDITEFANPNVPDAPTTTEVIETFEGARKPVIAAIHGTALGGGLETALGCHYRVATPSAKLGLPEVKLGILPGFGGTQRLPRLVGRGLATQLILSGEMIAADEALRTGLVNEVVEPDALLERARALLEQCLANGPRAVAASLTAIRNGLDLSLEDGLKVEANLFSAACGTAEMREGTSAFLEKREPDFKR